MIHPLKNLWFAPSSYYEGGQPITIDTVLNCVADAFNVTKADMLGKRRIKRFVEPRQVAQYILRHYLKLTLQDIADMFSGKHCTIMYSVNKVKDLMEVDKKYRGVVNKIIIKNNYFRNYER